MLAVSRMICFIIGVLILLASNEDLEQHKREKQRLLDERKNNGNRDDNI